ncbi:MAG: hypothetical protein KDD27_11310 [Saprospiraceae bacterium]|nr:hypothetical protein [Saprospiraceae bacterium]
MKSQLKTARRLMAEGTMEEIEKAFEVLFPLVEDKPSYEHQLTIIRSDYGQWKDRKLKDLGPPDSEKNAILDRMLLLIASLEKGEAVPTVSGPVKMLQGLKDAGEFVLGGIIDAKIFSFLVLLALWFGGGYLLGMFWARQENQQITDDEFYQQVIIGRMQAEINQEKTYPDGKVNFACGDQFAFQYNRFDNTWSEVVGDQYGAPPASSNLVATIPPALVGLAVPAGYQLFKAQLKAALNTNKGNWKNIAYTLMFASGTGYGYYNTRRKYPACDDPAIIRRLRSPVFTNQLATLIDNKLKLSAIKPGIILPDKGIVIPDSMIFKTLGK